MQNYQSNYEKNYKYVIQRILQNVKKGYYRSLNHFEEDLQKIQDKQVYIENDRLQTNYVENIEEISENSELLDNLEETLNINKNRTVKSTNHLPNTQKRFLKLGNSEEIFIGGMIFNNNTTLTFEDDTFVASVLFSLSDIYKFLDKKQQIKYKYALFEKILSDFDKDNLYEKLFYKKKRFKKQDLKKDYFNKSNLQLLGQILFMDYFKINILIYDNNILRPYIRYNPEYCGIVLTYKHKKFYPLLSEDLIQISKLEEFKIKKIFNIEYVFNPFLNTVLKGISSYKLADLQELARQFNIELTKVIDGKDKKKTKKDLYVELQTLYSV